MPSNQRQDQKREALREMGCLNSRPETVRAPLFQNSRFFDPRDVVQVKYEMVRSVEVDSRSVTAAAADFGFSRPAFYQAQEALTREGLAGLLPKKRGPRGGHKLTEEVIAFLEEQRATSPAASVRALAALAHKRFGLVVHPRSVTRALEKDKKKGR